MGFKLMVGCEASKEKDGFRAEERDGQEASMKPDIIGCNYATILAVMAKFHDLQYF